LNKEVECERHGVIPCSTIFPETESLPIFRTGCANHWRNKTVRFEAGQQLENGLLVNIDDCRMKTVRPSGNLRRESAIIDGRAREMAQPFPG
jgi:hypothetical protein